MLLSHLRRVYGGIAGLFGLQVRHILRLHNSPSNSPVAFYFVSEFDMGGAPGPPINNAKIHAHI